jgi:poly-beta-hydroxybutyrate-responsive repressor
VNEEALRYRRSPSDLLVPVMLMALRKWNSYGYELMAKTAGFWAEAINPGTLYRTLRQMENNGDVESTWDTTKTGPARRMYSITKAGESVPRLMDGIARTILTQHGRFLTPLPSPVCSGRLASCDSGDRRHAFPKDIIQAAWFSIRLLLVSSVNKDGRTHLINTRPTVDSVLPGSMDLPTGPKRRPF